MSLLFLTPQWLSICNRIKQRESFPAACGPVIKFLTPSLTVVPQSSRGSHTGLLLSSNMPDPSALGLRPSHSLCLPHSCTSFKVRSDTSLTRHFSRPSWLSSEYLSLWQNIALSLVVLTSLYHDKIYSYILIAYYISLLQDYKLHEDRIFFCILMYLHIELCLTHNRCSINICLIHWDHLRSRLRMNA